APGLRLRRPLVTLLLLATALAARAGAPPAAAAGDDEEPLPPVLFFGTPDPETRKQIEDVIDETSGDVSKAPHGRDLLVRRFGLWSAPAVVARIEAANNVPQVWNAALTIGSLRRAVGPSSLLWPAVRPLVKL